MSRDPSRRALDARDVATEVLFRVATGGAWAAPTLDAELARAALAPRDARLASAIVYGALRVLPSLDASLDAHLRDPGKVDPFVRAALRVGAFQVRHLPRVPERAAVHTAVEAVKRKRARLAGLTNAVLRKIRRPADCTPPRATELPAWLQGRLDGLGEARRVAFLGERALPPPLHLELFVDRDIWLADARAARPDATITALGLERAVAIERAGDPRTLPGYAEGAFRVQDLGSMRIARRCDVGPGERVLDACAGRGGKTVTFARAAGSEGRVVAVDLHEARVERVHAELARLHLPPVETHAIDWTRGTGGLEAGFDRVVVDAPCTGLGTVHRRPEILMRLHPESATELARVQQAILQSAASLTRAGGSVVYVVCSPDPIESAVTPGEGFEEAPFEDADSDGVLRVGPWSSAQDLEEQASAERDALALASDCDAYQVRRWRRT